MTHLLYVFARAFFWWFILLFGLFVGRGYWKPDDDKAKLPPPDDRLRPKQGL